ncbi:hypothetical protein H311_02622 [Anncaliia algerae PRA109]|nr:hypothetical protein H311_02622 [Anncaliia algerae PRA109]
MKHINSNNLIAIKTNNIIFLFVYFLRVQLKEELENVLQFIDFDKSERLLILGDFNIREKDKSRYGKFRLVKEDFLKIEILQVNYESPNLISIHSHIGSSTLDHVWCKDIGV